jgi:hypothetical protein
MTNDAKTNRKFPNHHLDTHTEIPVENYIFEVYSHSRDEGDRSLDDVVLSFLEDRATRTFADKRSKR